MTFQDDIGPEAWCPPSPSKPPTKQFDFRCSSMPSSSWPVGTRAWKPTPSTTETWTMAILWLYICWMVVSMSQGITQLTKHWLPIGGFNVSKIPLNIGVIPSQLSQMGMIPPCRLTDRTRGRLRGSRLRSCDHAAGYGEDTNARPLRC